MAWSITPNDATIDSNGNATITSRTISDKVYTITYIDTNGCTASTTYTLNGYNCNDDVHINSTIPTISSGGTSVQVGTYTSGAHDYISFTPTDNWLHLTAETNGNISMSADTNTSPERSTSVEVSMNGSSCTTFNVIQESGEQPCSCDSLPSITPMGGGNWDYNEFGSGYAKTWTITPACITPTLDNTEDFEMIITTTTSNKEIKVYPKNANLTSSSKNGEINYSWDCPNPIFTFTRLKQSGGSSSDDILVSINLGMWNNNTLAYGFYYTSNAQRAPFDIIMLPYFSSNKGPLYPCPDAISYLEKSLEFEVSPTSVNPASKESTWTPSVGIEFCASTIYQIKANGSVINNGDTITYGDKTYKIMWAL